MMNQTWVKICGLTNLEDARLALTAGADALGFILTPSPRQVEVDTAIRIRRTFPQANFVGVFTGEERPVILDRARRVGMTHIQLHREVDPRLVEDLSRDFQVIQAISVNPGAGLNSRILDIPAAYFLLDTRTGSAFGGTGKSFDWSILDGIDHPRVIVAGGLDDGNVGTLVRKHRPFGVDASSRLETSPGQKDPQKLQAFIQAVRLAEQES